MYECDLHTHTIRSDGHTSPLESVDRAAACGMKVLAITDHDTTLPEVLSVEKTVSSGEDGVPGETVRKMINAEKYAADKGVELVRGIEISCDTNNDDVHIIGLYCNWADPAFERLEKNVQKSRTDAYQEMMGRLVRAGYPVEWEEMLEYTGAVEHPERICKKQIFEYFAGKGMVKTWQDGKKWIQTTPEFDIPREKPDPVEIIGLLHRTGGTVILAHPFLIKEEPWYKGKKMSRYAYLDLLVSAGLDGIEACYTYDKTSYRGNLSREELEQLTRRRYEKSGIFFSGGSDFHGDYKTGLPNPRELGECGVSLEYYREFIRNRK